VGDAHDLGRSGVRIAIRQFAARVITWLVNPAFMGQIGGRSCVVASLDLRGEGGGLNKGGIEFRDDP